MICHISSVCASLCPQPPPFLFHFSDSVLIEGTWQEKVDPATKTTKKSVFTALRDMAPMLDSSNLPPDHDFFTQNIRPNLATNLLTLRDSQKKQLSTLGFEYFKDIHMYVGLRPKLYGLKFTDHSERVKCKGVSQRLVDLKFETLFKLAIGRDKVSHLVQQKNIISRNHQLFLKTYVKKAADALDMKRYFEIDNIRSHPFGSIQAITYQECYECLDSILRQL